MRLVQDQKIVGDNKIRVATGAVTTRDGDNKLRGRLEKHLGQL